MAKFVDNENYDSILEEAKSAKPVKRLHIAKKVMIAVEIVADVIIGLCCLATAATTLFANNENYSTMLDTTIYLLPIALFALIASIPSFFGIIILRGFERSAINRQIEEIRIKREEAERLNKTKQVAISGCETSNANAASDIKADEVVSEQQTAAQPTVDEIKLNELKEKIDVTERVNNMRKYIGCDILMMVLAVVALLILLLPFVTVWGEKYGVIGLYKTALKDPDKWFSFNFEENIYYDILTEVFKIESKYSTQTFAFVLAEMSVLVPIIYLVASLIYTICLVISRLKVSENIKDEKVVISTTETSRKAKTIAPVSSWSACWLVAVIPYVILLYGLYKYIVGDMNNELFSMSPLWLIISALFFIGSVVVMAVKRVSFKGNDQLRKDMIYFKLYRSEAMKFNKKLKKQNKI